MRDSSFGSEEEREEEGEGEEEEEEMKEFLWLMTDEGLEESGVHGSLAKGAKIC